MSDLRTGDEGGGSAIALGIVAILVAMTLAIAVVGSALHARTRLQGAADAAALAAADARSGLEPGFPCDRADEVAAAHDATVVACVADEATMTVVLTSTWQGMGITLTIEAAATAGPPPDG